MAYIKKINREARDAAIVASYNVTHNVRATAIEIGVSINTCRKALVAVGIDTKAVRTQDRLSKQPDRKPKANKKDNRLKPISMYTVNNEFVCDFASVSHALEYLRQQGFPKATLAGIVRALQGNRATAYGYKWKYQNEKLQKALYQYKKRRPVHMYTLSGEYVRTFPNVATAAKQLHIGVSHICVVCAGTHHSAGGYQWRYADTENEIPEDISSFNPVNAKPVVMYSLSGDKLQVFDSILSAAQYLHTQTNKSVKSLSSSIQQAVAGKIQTACGYQWRVLDAIIDYPALDIHKRQGKAITMCSLSGEELKTFHSAIAAAEYLVSVGLSTSAISAKGMLSKTINGKFKTAFGYQWRPAELH